MLYSISVPEKTLPGGTAAIFKKIFALSEPLLFIFGGLFSLKKMPKQLMIQLNQLALGGFVQKIRIIKGRKHARQGRFSFSAGLLRRSTGLAAGKRLIILKEGVE